MPDGSRPNVPLYLAAIVAILAAAALMLAFSMPSKAPEPLPFEQPIQNPYAKENRQGECTDGETRGCELGACEGARLCTGGSWGECALKRRACVPGKAIGCSLDGCSFGYKVCNECGTGFSECEKQASAPSPREKACDGNCT